MHLAENSLLDHNIWSITTKKSLLEEDLIYLDMWWDIM